MKKTNFRKTLTTIVFALASLPVSLHPAVSIHTEKGLDQGPGQCGPYAVFHASCLIKGSNPIQENRSGYSLSGSNIETIEILDLCSRLPHVKEKLLQNFFIVETPDLVKDSDLETKLVELKASTDPNPTPIYLIINTGGHWIAGEIKKNGESIVIKIVDTGHGNYSNNDRIAAIKQALN